MANGKPGRPTNSSRIDKLEDGMAQILNMLQTMSGGEAPVVAPKVASPAAPKRSKEELTFLRWDVGRDKEGNEVSGIIEVQAVNENGSPNGVPSEAIKALVNDWKENTRRSPYRPVRFNNRHGRGPRFYGPAETMPEKLRKVCVPSHQSELTE